MQLLLAARITRIDRTHRRYHVVVAINFVDEDDAGLSVFVGRRDNAVPDVRHIDHSGKRRRFDSHFGQIRSLECELIREGRGRTIGLAINHVVRTRYRIEHGLLPRLAVEFGVEPGAAVDGVHEPVRDGDRDIKICEAALIVLCVNEPENVRMQDREDAHVRTAPHTALFHDLSRLIDDVHEAHRARGNTSRRIDHRPGRAQKFIGHAGPAAGLMDDRDVLGVLHDPLYRIRNIQYKTCCELSLRLTGIDEARRVRHEFASEHRGGHFVVKEVLLLRVSFCRGNMPDDAANHVRPGFKRFSVLIL